MKNCTNAASEDLSRIDMPALSVSEEKILNIYWFKKELEEYLPQIATYATPKEITAITLSQLAIMENLIVQLLREQARRDNKSLDGNDS